MQRRGSRTAPCAHSARIDVSTPEPAETSRKVRRRVPKELPPSDAVGAAEDEVRRHPQVVQLVDVGLFRQLQKESGAAGAATAKQLQQSSQKGWVWSASIGLVFELYEVDVRQFLQKSVLTQSGARHVLTSVLEALHFIHDHGCIHCDVKPANVFMRGATHLRGCFGKEALTKREHGERDPVAPSPHSLTEFQYQIPKSFQARGSARMWRFDLESTSNQHC